MRAWQWAAHCSTFLKQNAGAFLQGACLYHVICNYGGFFSTVQGPSMFPTFRGWGINIVFAECLPGVADRVGVGDVVICSQPSDVRDHVIKRVTALAGQDVAVFKPGSAVPLHITVPPGHMWLQGDNLNVSRDSRDYGPVPLGLVKGRAVLQMWPHLELVSNKLPGSC